MEVKRTCRTCQHSHVKDDAFPCRSCDTFTGEYTHWKLAAKDPWPMFPLKPDPWKQNDLHRNIQET